MFMNLTIHDTKRFTIHNISSPIHYLYLASTTLAKPIFGASSITPQVFRCLPSNPPKLKNRIASVLNEKEEVKGEFYVEQYQIWTFRVNISIRHRLTQRGLFHGIKRFNS